MDLTEPLEPKMGVEKADAVERGVPLVVCWSGNRGAVRWCFAAVVIGCGVKGAHGCWRSGARR